MENYKYCTDCGAQNEQHSKFCCNCGKVFDDQPQQNQQFYNSEYGRPYNNQYNPSGYGNPYNTNYGAPYSQGVNYDGDIFGVPAKEIAAFVGVKSAPNLMPDFYKKAARGSKAGFNIVVFLLGFFLGPIVMSFWFFHKKMNKIGATILAIALALSACPTMSNSFLGDIIEKSINYDYETEFSDTNSLFAKNTDENSGLDGIKIDNFNYSYGDYDYDFDFDEDFDYSVDIPSLEESGVSYGTIAIMILLPIVSSIGSLALIIVCSIFANAWYLKFIIEKITQLKEKNPQISLMDISLAGGTSATIWAILLIAFIVGSFIFSTAYFFNFITDATNSVTNNFWR